MPAGKKLKLLVGQQHRRVPRQTSAGRLTPPSAVVLLRRLYFLNRERCKYTCLGFYPDRSHCSFFELDGVMQSPLDLHPSLVSTLALHLPRLCENLARGERYMCTEMSFWMQTVAEKAAIIAFDRTSVTLNVPEFEYLMLNLTALSNQLARYKLAEADVSAYVQSSAGPTTFVRPTKSASLLGQCDVLFEEINRSM